MIGPEMLKIQLMLFIPKQHKCSKMLNRSQKGHLVVVQVKQSQIPHLIEGTRRDLGNAIPTEAKLLQACWEA